MLPEDIDDLRQIQDDDDYQPVKVRVIGPQLHHDLPARYAYSRNVTVGTATDPASLENIAPGDLRIKFIIVTCTTNPVYLGFDKQAVSDGICGILGVGQLLTLPVSAPIWVRSTTATAVVSWWAANWAD